MSQYRRLPLKGLYNCRDLGGFPTDSGRPTRFGVFLRSEAPCELPREDVDALIRYGVTGSMDLRSEGERLARPNELQGRAAYYPLSLVHRAAVFGDESQQKKEFDWGDQYREMAEDNARFFREALPICLKEPGVLLYHCTTGKDRTGLLTCVLLSIAGVSREDIAADYCVSELYLGPVYERMKSGMMKLGVQPDGKHTHMPDGGSERFFATPAKAMLSLIDGLERDYGGVVGFVRACGVEEETIIALRRKMLG
ncbi:MAG: tyrosine-protein phosphatase [Oscillospiraceae bacterium]|nr:tyrosine-protein phosphatase [Oscillospiraceae bacterium]